MFDEFWKEYPRHVNKAKAKMAFDRLHVTEDMLGQMITALKQQKETEQWKKDNGQFIPHPTTWLNGRRWEDEIPGQISIFGEEDDGRQ